MTTLNLSTEPVDMTGKIEGFATVIAKGTDDGQDVEVTLAGSHKHLMLRVGQYGAEGTAYETLDLAELVNEWVSKRKAEAAALARENKYRTPVGSGEGYVYDHEASPCDNNEDEPCDVCGGRVYWYGRRLDPTKPEMVHVDDWENR